ncbi:hypothetical protein IJS77_00900 [bacterium]|nr:hypothetical protein [bacterium]
MNKKLLITALSIMLLGSIVVIASETTSNSNSQTQFERGMTPPNGQNFENGQPPQINGNSASNQQFNGRRPSKKPDSKPGGDRTPQEWESDNGQTQNTNTQNNRPPMPANSRQTTSTSESK